MDYTTARDVMQVLRVRSSRVTLTAPGALAMGSQVVGAFAPCEYPLAQLIAVVFIVYYCWDSCPCLARIGLT